MVKRNEDIKRLNYVCVCVVGILNSLYKSRVDEEKKKTSLFQSFRRLLLSVFQLLLFFKCNIACLFRLYKQ